MQPIFKIVPDAKSNVEAKYQFYKQVTQKDPITEEEFTMNVVDGLPVTRTVLLATKDALTVRIAVMTARINAIDAQQ